MYMCTAVCCAVYIRMRWRICVLFTTIVNIHERQHCLFWLVLLRANEVCIMFVRICLNQNEVHF